MTGRGGKGAHKVNMDVGIGTGRDWDRLRAKVGVLVDFGGLAGDAGAAPAGDVGGKVNRPDLVGGDEAAGSAADRVG